MSKAYFKTENMDKFPGIQIYMNQTEDRVYMHINHIDKYSWIATEYGIIPNPEADATLGIVLVEDDGLSDDDYNKYYGVNGARILIFLPEDYEYPILYESRCKEQQSFVFLKKNLHTKQDYITEQLYDEK